MTNYHTQSSSNIAVRYSGIAVGGSVSQKCFSCFVNFPFYDTQIKGLQLYRCGCRIFSMRIFYIVVLEETQQDSGASLPAPLEVMQLQ